MKLLRHIDACNNAVLPGQRRVLALGGRPIGWVTAPVAAMLGDLGVASGGLAVRDAAQLGHVARRLAERGAFAWRDEAFDVLDAAGTVLGVVDRGALPLLGLVAHGVHLNGLVERDGALHMWLGRRAADKLLDPGKLDHIVAGGVPAGLDARRTLVKEAGEEAGLSPELAAAAQDQGTIRYVMERPEGLRRDVLHCYDLVLPPEFVPRPVDGEVAGFELWPIGAVLERVLSTDDFKFNVSLVLIDLFLRRGLVAGPDASVLRAALHREGRRV